MHYALACRKRLLQILIFLFIINKSAPLQNVCGQNPVQFVIGFFAMFKRAPVHYALACSYLSFANCYLPLYYQQISATAKRMRSKSRAIRYRLLCYV